MNIRILRKFLVLTFLVVGLVMVNSYNTTSASSNMNCSLNWSQWEAASDEWDSSYQSYYRNNPTSCLDECVNSPTLITCLNNCETARYERFAWASSITLVKAQATCAPLPQPDQCQAAFMAHQMCLLKYNPYDITDPEELGALSDARTTCIEAAKYDGYCV